MRNYHMAKHSRWITSTFRVENGYSLENFHGIYLVPVCVHWCPLAKAASQSPATAVVDSNVAAAARVQLSR